MKVNVSDLDGRALNWAVAYAISDTHRDIGSGQTEFMINGKIWVVSAQGNEADDTEFDPQGNWAHGGKLIGAYKVKLCPAPDGYDASIHQVLENHPDIEVIMHGSAPLQATCLCVVKFLNQCADEIEIPDELCEVKS